MNPSDAADHLSELQAAAEAAVAAARQAQAASQGRAGCATVRARHAHGSHPNVAQPHLLSTQLQGAAVGAGSGLVDFNQVHAADGAVAEMVLVHLRVHGAGVVAAQCGRCRGRRGIGLHGGRRFRVVFATTGSQAHAEGQQQKR